MPITIDGTGNITGLTSGAGIASTALSGQVPDANAPSGSVIQVLQSVKTDKFTTTSGSPTDVSGLSISITPSSASSKFLVFYSICVGGVVDSYIGLNLVRNGTALSLGTSGTGSQTNVTTGAGVGLSGNWDYKLQTAHYEYLDSPSTASAITYKVQAFSTYVNREMTINKPQRNDDDRYIIGASSSITVMEIAA